MESSGNTIQLTSIPLVLLMFHAQHCARALDKREMGLGGRGGEEKNKPTDRLVVPQRCLCPIPTTSE